MAMGGMYDKGGHAWQRVSCMVKEACMARGHVWQGACMAEEIASAADGMHHPGIHSC